MMPVMMPKVALFEEQNRGEILLFLPCFFGYFVDV